MVNSRGLTERVCIAHNNRYINPWCCVLTMNVASTFYAGHILTVETISTPIVNGKLDCRITRWSENIVDDCPYVFSIRVFHSRHSDGQHSKHSNIIDAAKIGMYDFLVAV